MLIVDMPMPKGCYFCPMSATYPTDWYCNAFDDSTSIDGCAPMKERPSWCPIKGELVRCGECEHRKPPTDYCEKLCKAYVPDDFYCKYGERKEKEND